jgi:hypothetical protein
VVEGGQASRYYLVMGWFIHTYFYAKLSSRIILNIVLFYPLIDALVFLGEK